MVWEGLKMGWNYSLNVGHSLEGFLFLGGIGSEGDYHILEEEPKILF